MIGCFAEALTTEITIDAAELQDAQWFTRAEALSALAGNGPFRCSPPFAISHTLLKTWAEL
jgi:NAD+ diphosphatase